MDTKAIISLLKQFASSAAAVIKETIRLPYAKTYLLLSLLFIILFALFMFPVEIFINRGIENIEKSMFAQLSAENLDINYITDSTMDEFVARFKDGDELRLTDVTLDLNLIGLMLSHVLGFDYHPNGSLSVQKISYETENVSIRGTLNASVDVIFRRATSSLQKGGATILLQNATVRIGSITLPEEMGGLDLEIPAIHCPSLNLEAVISENNIQFKNCLISGTDLKGGLSGNIGRSRMFQNSSLNLNLTIDENSKILEKYTILIKKYISNGKLAIHFKGTVGRPEIRFAQ